MRAPLALSFAILAVACVQKPRASSPAPAAARAPNADSTGVPASGAELPLGVDLAVQGISPTALRRLVVAAHGLELLSVLEDSRGAHLIRTEIDAGGASASVELVTLTKTGRVLRFDAVRDGRGIYHAAAIVDAKDHVEVITARSDGKAPRVTRIASPSTTGFVDHGPDGKAPYPRAYEYRSIGVAAGRSGSTFVVWTSGYGTGFSEIDENGRATTQELEGAGQSAAIAVAADDVIHVLSAGSPNCRGQGPECDDRVTYARRDRDGWRSTTLEVTAGLPVLALSPGGSVRASLGGESVNLATGSAPARPFRLVPAPGAEFGWSTLLAAAGGVWFVGLSDRGTLHALPLQGDAPRVDLAERTPVVDLLSVPADAIDPVAIGSSSSVYLAYATPREVRLRRLALPAAPAPERKLTELRWEKPEAVRLGSRDAFGDIDSPPKGASWASLRYAYDASCIVPRARSVEAARDALLLPASEALRLATAADESTWKIEQFRFDPPLVAKPGERLTPSRGFTLAENASACPGREYALSAPRRASAERLVLGRHAHWVASYADAAFAVTEVPGGMRLVRLDWARTPLGVRDVAELPSGTDWSSVRVRRARDGTHYLSYGLTNENAVMLVRLGGPALQRIPAEKAAFALTLDANDRPVWLVRRDGRLLLERLGPSGVQRRELARTDALPLALFETQDGTVGVALRTPSEAIVAAFFAKSGASDARLIGSCATRAPSAAEFYGTDHLAFDCAR